MDIVWILVFIALAIVVVGAVVWRRNRLSRRRYPVIVAEPDLPYEEECPTVENLPVPVDHEAAAGSPVDQSVTGGDWFSDGPAHGSYDTGVDRIVDPYDDDAYDPVEASYPAPEPTTSGLAARREAAPADWPRAQPMSQPVVGHAAPSAEPSSAHVVHHLEVERRVEAGQQNGMWHTNTALPIDALAPSWPSFDLSTGGTGHGPLPRSGLFVRRNNAFGTKATLGIADLIDQGVLIDQTQIRFDDFISSNPSGIPAPAPGEAIAVSYGMCAVEENFRANSNTTHSVELALRAGEIPRGASSSGESLPVNFVFVVDTSGSMEGSKLDTVKTAIRELHSQLRDTDILGIVTFDTEVRTVLKATPKNAISWTRLDEIVAALDGYGGTDINMGVLYGIDEIARHSRTDMVNCVYLFSDGEPNSGERNWITIRRNIADRIRGDLTLSCFGFGQDARMRELEALAGITGGFCTLVTNPDDVRLNLAEDLARREHLAAINIQLQIELDATVTAWHLYGHDLITDPAARARVERDVVTAKHRARDEIGVESLPDLVTEDDGIRIFAPDLAFDETYWVVLEVRAPEGWTGLGKATVQYVDAVAKDNRRHVVNLGHDTTIAAETVFAHAVGLWTSEITFFALDDLYRDDREAAGRRLSEHVEVLGAAHARVPAQQFREDQTTFRKLISLAGNLGLVRAWTDRGDAAYTIFAMNKFGQSRSGFVRNRYL